MADLATRDISLKTLFTEADVYATEQYIFEMINSI
jgi:hypothetical protein